MSLAIQWGYDNTQQGELGFLYLDSVQLYKQTFSGSVTKHPIDGGGNITDHFTRENPTITVSAVISGVDVSIGLLSIEDDNGFSPTNIKTPVAPVQVNSDDKSLVNFLPSSVGQFFTPQKPKVVLASQSVDTLQQIKESLQNLFLKNTIQFIKLYEYDGVNLRNKPTERLVITNFTLTEDINSGEGLNCDFTLEQITIANYKKTSIPNNIRLSNAESLSDKGKVDSTPISGAPTALLDRNNIKPLKESLAYKAGFSSLLGGE